MVVSGDTRIDGSGPKTAAFRGTALPVSAGQLALVRRSMRRLSLTAGRRCRRTPLRGTRCVRVLKFDEDVSRLARPLRLCDFGFAGAA